MTRTKPWHYLTLQKSDKKEVRHLLIVFVNGSSETQLVQFADGVESTIATGTEYETKLQADTLAQAWSAAEGFERLSQGKFAFELLERTVALAIRLGFSVIYDERFKRTNLPNPNFIGAVSLSKWPGMTAKNGGGYIYALDQMRLYAQPTLPPSLTPLIAPTDGKTFAAFVLKQKAALDAVGPFAEFVLGGD